MSRVWADIDREVANTPMPREYLGLHREILCKDCNRTSIVAFHIVGMKCRPCGSYNTALDKGPLLRLESKEGEDPVFTPLTEEELASITRRVNMRMAGRQLRRWMKTLMMRMLIWLKKI